MLMHACKTSDILLLLALSELLLHVHGFLDILNMKWCVMIDDSTKNNCEYLDKNDKNLNCNVFSLLR